MFIDKRSLQNTILYFLLLLVFSSCRSKELNITILQTSDVHAAIFPYDFIRAKETDHSLAQVHSYVKKMRKTGNQEVILLDNGDILQGQPTVYYSNYEEPELAHICSRVMNYMHYDAGTVGNHDIEAGHSVYDKIVKEFDFPWLAANAVDTETGEPYFEPYTVIYKKGVKIVVFGLITPGIPKWLPEELWKGIEFKDMVETAGEWVPAIIEDENPDILVGLFHAGHDASYGGVSAGDYLNENASLRVVQEVPGFDIVFIGHDHDVYKEWVESVDGSKVLVLDPGSSARYISSASIKLEYEGKGKSRSYKKQISGRLLETSGLDPDKSFMKKFSSYSSKIDLYVSRKVGETDRALNSTDALFGDSPFGDLIHSVQLELSGADISFTAPLSINARLDSGNLLVKDMFQLYRFENFLYTMMLSGKEVHDYLEYSYELWFNTMQSDKDDLLKFIVDEKGRPLKHERYPVYRLANAYYNFDSAEGIEYIVDVSKKIGERVEILSMTDGSVFEPGGSYSVAINSYRANGGGGHLTVGAGIPREELADRILNSTSRDLRYYLMKWIESNSPLSPEANMNWKVIPRDWWEKAYKRDYELLFKGE